MKMSCNGCRVLRKGCSESCVLRPCLQWIRTAESQANATVFLAKFYGRAGLLNLIADGPEHLRPAIFRSLLYEACGRMVNPTYGSVGLLMSGDWKSCEAGVELILQGRSIYPRHFNLPDNADPSSNSLREQCNRSANTALLGESVARELQKVKSRGQFKSSAQRMKRSGAFVAAAEEDTMQCGSSKRRALMADAAQLNWHSNASSSESDGREDEDRHNSSESEIQMINMISKPPPEVEYPLCARNVELELTLGSPRTSVDWKSYSGNAPHECTEDSPILTRSALSL